MTENPDVPKKRNWLFRLIGRLFGIPQEKKHLIHLLHQAQDRHVIAPDSLKMLEGVILISDMRVSEIMIPKSNMVALERDWPLDKILKTVSETGYSRFPVIGDSSTEVVGILLAKDLLAYASGQEEKFSIRDLLRPARFVPESKRLNVLLNDFKVNRNHLAIVVDEYGTPTGLITIEDVMEQIVGEIEDEHDTDDESSIRKHKDDQYSIKASTPIEEFNEYFNTSLSHENVDTIGGLVMAEFSHLPKRGESITIEGIPFTVLRASKRRIQLLRINLADHSKKEDPQKE